MMAVRPLWFGIGSNFTSAAEEETQKEVAAAKAGSFRQPILQIAEQEYAEISANQALEAAGYAKVSPTLGWVLCLTPILTFLAVELLPDGAIRSALQTFQNHFGRLCRVATVVSQIALFYLTQSPLALVVLGVLALGVLDRNQLLHAIHPNVSWAYNFVAVPLLTACQVALYGPLSLWGALAIGGLVVHYWRSSVSTTPIWSDKVEEKSLDLNHIRWEIPNDNPGKADVLRRLQALRTKLFFQAAERCRFHAWLVQRGFPNARAKSLNLLHANYPTLFMRTLSDDELRAECKAIGYTAEKVAFAVNNPDGVDISLLRNHHIIRES